MPGSDRPDARPPSSDSESMRLNKALALAGVASRRAADVMVRAGRVTLNGRPAQLGDVVRPGDQLAVDGRTVGLAPRQGHVYLMLNKPVEVVSTAHDPEGRRTVLDLARPAAPGARLFPVGRLDYFSQGLILLTTDGDLANRLMHPSWHLPKRYRVLVRGDAPQEALDAMRSGMRLAEGERLAPVKVEQTARIGRDSILEMVLIQGVNRQIRRMCRDLGLTILRLERVSQGPVELGDLPVGGVRPLRGGEVAALKRAVGLA
ncbi:Ribosomal large subunit pseudouridine synthase B [Fundidesulfovibrio magnetotacticus]|uniref:Pseudouridine synthase n=1 Tax=Fundidesulfovibrio magnetotacticus TaxID=2730080 RepID=A0A6V8LSV5_9BACT|nr:Ribosomal large subunit pseudouridine synthase B [Fundidesulfovibrio magnetotacticus]